MNRIFVLVTCLMSCATAGNDTRHQAGFQAKLKPSARELKYPVIDFRKEVDADTVFDFIKELRVQEAIGTKKVIVVIDSPGGEIYAGLEMARQIENSPIKVVCVVDGMAASMAEYILQSCDERIMTKRSLLMIHEPATMVQGHAYKLREMADLLDKMSKALVEHIAAKMNISPEDLSKKIEHGFQWWMAKDEAMEYGAVDRVVRSVWDLQN